MRCVATLARATLASLLLWACDRPVLVVDLRTDLVPGAEFDRVESVLDGLGAQAAALELQGSENALRGLRVARFELDREGPIDLRVALFRGGGEVAARRVIVRPSRSTITTVLITRDCRGVQCEDREGEARSCVAGLCADARCSDDNPDYCPPAECASDADCPVPIAGCAAARCDLGRCLVLPNDVCTSVDWCDPEVGCRPLPSDPGEGNRDAGPATAFDAGPLERLVLTTVGAGQGQLVPSPVGASCGADCYLYPRGTTVTVEGRPARTTDRFLGFMGDEARPCQGRDPCAIAVDAPRELVGGFGEVRRRGDVMATVPGSIQAIEVGPDGTVYLSVASGWIGRIRAGSSTFEPLAGASEGGFADGLAARFALPKGLELQPDNALLIADTENHRVRRLDLASGVTSTWAGTGIPGGTTGDRSSALLRLPRAVARRSDGAIFIADEGNDRVAIVDVSGQLREYVGLDAWSVVVSRTEDDVLWVLASSGSRVFRARGTDPLESFGGRGYRDGANPRLPYPTHADDLPYGNLAILTPQMVHELLPDGSMRTVAGGGTDGEGWDLDLAFDGRALGVADDGTVYVGCEDGRLLRLR